MLKKLLIGVVFSALVGGYAEGGSQKGVPSIGIGTFATDKDSYRLTPNDWNEAIKDARSYQEAGIRMPLTRKLSEWDRREIVRGLKHWGFPTKEAKYRWPEGMARIKVKGEKEEAQWVCFGYKPERYSEKIFDPNDDRGKVQVSPKWYIGIGAGGVYSQPKGESWETVVIKTGPHASDQTYRGWLGWCINAYGLDYVRSLIRP